MLKFKKPSPKINHNLVDLALPRIKKNLQAFVDRDQSIVHENANKDSRVFNTQRDLLAGTIAKGIGLSYFSPMIQEAHQAGDIHIHDLDYQPFAPMTNCSLIDFETMFTHGFQIGNAQVEPPKSINTATAQMAQIIANVSSCQYGGTTVNRIDQLLAPYGQMNYDKHLVIARKWLDEPEACRAYAEEQTKKDIYDAMQSLEYEINTLYSSHGQTPFTTVNFGLGTSWIEREIQKSILSIRIQGLGRDKRTAIFPKLVFTLKRGVNLNPEDPNYDIKQLALKSCSQRMYPDVLMYDKTVEITGSFKAPMGCRSFLHAWENPQGQEVHEGRLNLGVVTLNLPRLALLSQGDPQVFWQDLDEKIDWVRQALLTRIQATLRAKPENAPILYQHGAFGHYLRPDEDVNQVFTNDRATVSFGYIGLYETVAVFFGPTWETNSVAKTFSLKILEKLRDACQAWSDQYGYHFSVYGTPSESLTDRFCRLDRDRFGDIEDITDKGYYTNSFHYDVRKHPNCFEKLDFEKDYPYYSSGGFIHYCEYPSLKHNLPALEAVWDFAYDRVAYLGTNTPIDKCYQCDYQGEFEPTAKGFKCPQCGNQDPASCDVVKRTCGYLGNPLIRPMVAGRHQEIANRVKHGLGEVDHG